MRCAICDDDYDFLRTFSRRVAVYFGRRALPCESRVFLTPSELLMESIDSFDIVFLNVDMGYWDGINIARSIRAAGSDTLIILVSAYVQFAPQGYGVGAFRFLLKNDLDTYFTPAMDDALAALGAAAETLTVKSHKEEYTLSLSSIIYAESDKRVVTFHLSQARPKQLNVYMKLADLETELQGKGFLRVHKSYLVNMRCIDSIKNYIVYLKDGAELQASRQNYRQVSGAFAEWKDACAAGSASAGQNI